MMKMFRLMTLSALLVCSMAAAADSAPPTKTYEAMIKSVRLPNAPYGTLAVRTCADCDFERFRVTASTTYRIDKKNMRLREFRATIERLGLSGEHNVNVRRDLRSNTIASVYLSTE